MAREEDHHRVLGVARDASPPEIRRAYRRLAHRHHPDHNPGRDSADRFRALTDAYSALTDPARRAGVGAGGRVGQPDGSPPPSAPGWRGVLELSLREAQLAAVTSLTLTGADGGVIVLPAGLRDGDTVTLSAGSGTVRLVVRVSRS
jgi:curved DNA-binding protein CbpA